MRAMGKQGDLVAAVISATDLRALGLKLVRTVGGTPNPAVNALHHEARLPWYRRVALAIRRKALGDYFNEQLSPQLCRRAQVLE